MVSDPEAKPLRGKELDQVVSSFVVSRNTDSEQALRELGDAIQDWHDNPQGHSDDFSLDDRIVKLAPVRDHDRLFQLLEVACLEGNWGGLLVSRDYDLKTICTTWEHGDFDGFRPYDDGGLFEKLAILEEEAATGSKFYEAVEQFVAARETLTAKFHLLVNYPLILFGGYSEARVALRHYLDAYALILSTYRKSAPKLLDFDSLETRDAAVQLLRLDVIYIKTPDEWKAILSPLHPLHLWRYHEVLSSTKDASDARYTDDELAQLSRALPNMPHLLHFIIVDNEIAATRPDVVILPQSGSLGFLPTYENRTNRYLGTDGIDFLETVITQWISYAPYSEPQLRIAVIDVPDLAHTLKTLANYVDVNRDSGIVLSVYSSQGRNYQIELTRMDYTDEDYNVASLMQNGRIRVAVKSESTTIGEIIADLHSNPNHIVYAFDQAQPQVEHSQRAHLIVSPLVINYEYDYSPIQKRGTITPSSAAEDGLFGDFYYLVEHAGQLPAGMQLRLKYGEDVDIRPFSDLLAKGSARWLAIADRVLSAYYAPTDGIPLGERRVGQREVTVWTRRNSAVVQRLISLLRNYNLDPDHEVVLNLIKSFGHVASEGILGLSSINRSIQTRQSQEKGLLGTMLVAKWYTTVYPGSLIASLDSDLAKNWLQGRSTSDQRADLIGVHLEDEVIVFDAIEVKSHKALAKSDFNLTKDDAGYRRLQGHAIEQLKSIIDSLNPIFDNDEEQPLFTPARRETLKYQLYRECFREVHDEDWRSQWYQQLKAAFGSAKDRVRIRGLLLHVQLEEDANREVIGDGIEPLCFIRIGSGEIQELIIEGGRVEPIESTFETSEPQQTKSPGQTSNRSDSQTDEGLHTGASEPLPREGSTNRGASVAAVTNQPLSNAQRDEIEELARRFIRSCNSYKISISECDPDEARLGPNVWRLYVRLTAGQSIRPLETHLDDISREMRRSGLLFSSLPNSDLIAVDIPRLEKEIIFFDDAIDKLPEISSVEQMPILVGMTPEGGTIVPNLDEMPHLLVGGTTGAGKTMFLYFGVIAPYSSKSTTLETVSLIGWARRFCTI